jgi:hypothetical protein
MDEFELKPRNISISVFENNKDKIESSGNGSQSYIIFQNEELNNQNKNYCLEIAELKKANLDQEEQIDKLENSTRYMRGILHNFTEKVKLQKDLIKYYINYHQKLKDYTKSINTLAKKSNDFCRKFIFMYNLIIMSLCFTGTMSYVSLISYNIVMMVAVGITVAQTQIDYLLIKDIDGKTKSINDVQKSDKLSIDQIKEKIDEIDKSNNFIEDYINVV